MVYILDYFFGAARVIANPSTARKRSGHANIDKIAWRNIAKTMRYAY
ncbi:hypothetical protein [Pseudomonas sp. MPB26]